ncbi:MAG: hypothetical protein HKO76_04615 [Acidimicrobiia bacterium]|nr:hypothetical protein [Acidimicrobiia bacterium]
MAEFGRVRALVLKGRQQGISTYVEGRLYWRVTTNKGVRAYILTHEREATTNLFDMVQRYHDHCPPLVKPISGKTNAKELLFDRLDSGYKVGTAGAKGTGRSSTIQYFHGSEVAFWPHAESHQSGVMQAIPDEPGTEEILESTANGVGGVFHGLWEESERGQNEYEPIFIPWYWQPEYRRDARDLIMDPEERELAKLYRLDPEQIAWRRARIAKLKSLDLFHQEYPCNAKEAFLYSGRPVFMPAWLDKAEQECFRPKYLGEIRLGTDTIDKRKDGALSVWFECAYGDKYVIGADVAEGVVKGDYSSADVLRVRDGLQVAQWHGKVDPDQYASILAFLGKRYNKALVGVERNNHGLTTLTSLRNLGYSNVYTQRDIEQRSEGKELKKFGWLTTQKSKIKIIDQLSAELRDREHGIVSRETIDEMRTFVIEDNGSYGAKPGCFDDRVMSRAIAGEMLRAVPKGWRA